MAGAAQRLEDLKVLLQRCRNDWRGFFIEMEAGEESLQPEDPYADLDGLLGVVDAEARAGFHETINEMLESGDPDDLTQALSILAACKEPFDLSKAIAHEAEIAHHLEAHASLLLAIGMRLLEDGRPAVMRALKEPTRRHAALICLAQLDPRGAAEEGRKQFATDRSRILAILDRPLEENEYATFYEMSKGVLQVRGKEGLNEFLRAVSEGHEMDHDLALLARRLIRQNQWESDDDDDEEEGEEDGE